MRQAAAATGSGWAAAWQQLAAAASQIDSASHPPPADHLTEHAPTQRCQVLIDSIRAVWRLATHDSEDDDDNDDDNDDDEADTDDSQAASNVLNGPLILDPRAGKPLQKSQPGATSDQRPAASGQRPAASGQRIAKWRNGEYRVGAPLPT
ncbi:uncharacterized protein UV8b_00702 [Ustilaginoidea virens]|uniref:Uncharacterized protein n=1 Tax=Ustilaginoidea virens TaxID=1159556 RepID=A0A8E5MEK6_USTVR|nr:uncharacterized protein UV8b_00702 [Ustilaginoidea virens]QUC16461.1 hypothetical protein UV8b_00702 [Ustilaginoidea virens]